MPQGPLDIVLQQIKENQAAGKARRKLQEAAEEATNAQLLKMGHRAQRGSNAAASRVAQGQGAPTPAKPPPSMADIMPEDQINPVNPAGRAMQSSGSLMPAAMMAALAGGGGARGGQAVQQGAGLVRGMGQVPLANPQRTQAIESHFPAPGAPQGQAQAGGLGALLAQAVPRQLQSQTTRVGLTPIQTPGALQFAPDVQIQTQTRPNAMTPGQAAQVALGAAQERRLAEGQAMEQRRQSGLDAMAILKDSPEMPAADAHRAAQAIQSGDTQALSSILKKYPNMNQKMSQLQIRNEMMRHTVMLEQIETAKAQRDQASREGRVADVQLRLLERSLEGQLEQPLDVQLGLSQPSVPTLGGGGKGTRGLGLGQGKPDRTTLTPGELTNNLQKVLKDDEFTRDRALLQEFQTNYVRQGKLLFVAPGGLGGDAKSVLVPAADIINPITALLSAKAVSSMTPEQVKELQASVEQAGSGTKVGPLFKVTKIGERTVDGKTIPSFKVDFLNENEINNDLAFRVAALAQERAKAIDAGLKVEDVVPAAPAEEPAPQVRTSQLADELEQSLTSMSADQLPEAKELLKSLRLKAGEESAAQSAKTIAKVKQILGKSKQADAAERRRKLLEAARERVGTR